MLNYDFYIPIEWAIANVELCDLDLHFQGETFQTLLSKTVRASIKMRTITFIVVGIRHHLASGNVVLDDLDLNFQRQTCETLLYRKL